MKRLIGFVIVWAFSAMSYSQTISVSSFNLLDTDLTANTAGTMEQDQNGETAALIKVVTTQTGFTFDGGSMGIVKTKQTPGEIWIYLPRGSKKISIKHPELGVLRDYYFPIVIEAARTYEMTLVTGEVQTIVKQTSNSQYLIIKITPADAVVELNNEILKTTDGYAQKYLKLGTYEYRVQAQDYHTTAGVVTIDDPKNKKVLEINLQPAFGWIEFPSHEEYNGAQVFIDNSLAGYIPMKSKNLSSGEHNIKIVKELYKPFFQRVTVKDSETTTIVPLLDANYSEITINVDNNADIYVNEEKKGTGSWIGKLEPGSYMLEAKKPGHRSTSMIYEVLPETTNQQVKLETPTPIYGEANITSDPSISDVFLDGVHVGKTPLLLSDILVGEHEIKIKHDGYNEYNSTLVVSENKITEFKASMQDEKLAKVKFRCNVPGAIVYVDGKRFGIIEDLKYISPGTHEIIITSAGFKDYAVIIDVGLPYYECNVKMIPDKSTIKRKYKKKRLFGL